MVAQFNYWKNVERENSFLKERETGTDIKYHRKRERERENKDKKQRQRYRTGVIMLYLCCLFK